MKKYLKVRNESLMITGLIIVWTIVSLYAQNTGTVKQLRGKTDSNGNLILALGTAGVGQNSQPTVLANLRLKTDSNNNLLVNVSGGAGAPTDATYITQTPNSTLTAEQALSALSTGILKSTTTTGVVSSIAQTNLTADFLLGDASFGRTFAAGTLTASNPWTYTATLNNGAVTFEVFKINVVKTASGSASKMFSIQNAGVDTVFLNNQFQLQTNNDIISGTNFQFADTGFVQTGTRTYFHAPTNRDFAIGSNGSSGVEYTIKVGAVPTLTSGWGTGATIVGTNSIGRITIGTTPGASGVLTFSQAFTTNAPVCFAIDETSGVVLPTSATTTAVTITGIFTLSDKISYNCPGFQ